MGKYSDQISEGTLSETFLRGYQISDANDFVSFSTIWPGWYQGRTTHLQVMARTFDANNKQTYRGTTQLYFNDTLNDEIYKLSPYNTHDTKTTRNQNDRIFSQDMVLPLTGSPEKGYVAQMHISIPFAK